MRGKFLDPLSTRDDKTDHVRSAGGPTGLIAVADSTLPWTSSRLGSRGLISTEDRVLSDFYNPMTP